MTMTTSVPNTARTPWLRIVLIALAALETLNAISDLPSAFVARDQRIGLAAFLVSVPTVAGILGVLAFTVSRVHLRVLNRRLA